MQTLRRNRLGNDTEDITYFTGIPRTGGIAILDGYDVLSPASNLPVPPVITQSGSTSSQGAKTAPVVEARPTPKLFDVLGLKIKASPRGITYCDSQAAFVFNDPLQTSRLFLTDKRGQATSIIDIQYPNGGTPLAVEGLAYIPQGAPQFPDHLVMVTSFLNADSESEARLEVISLTGEVVREIVPQGDLAATFLTGACFKSPGSLLVSSDDDELIYELDFDGNQIAVFNASQNLPPTPPLLSGIEGIVQPPNGKVAAASGFTGFLVTSDLNLKPSPPQIVDYRIGPGLSLPSGLAWESSTGQFLLIGLNRQQNNDQALVRLIPSLTKFIPVLTVDQLTRKVTYLPDENLIATTHANAPRGIVLFDKKGGAAGQIDTTALGTPLVISYIPTKNEFVLVFRDPQDASKRRKLFILTRAGAVSRIIDLGPAGITRIAAVTFFNPQHPSGGQFLVIDGDDNIGVVTDFAGTKLSEFSVRDTLNILTPTAVTAITTGPDAGAFAAINGENSELVVFRLD